MPSESYSKLTVYLNFYLSLLFYSILHKSSIVCHKIVLTDFIFITAKFHYKPEVKIIHFEKWKHPILWQVYYFILYQRQVWHQIQNTVLKVRLFTFLITSRSVSGIQKGVKSLYIFPQELSNSGTIAQHSQYNLFM